MYIYQSSQSTFQKKKNFILNMALEYTESPNYKYTISVSFTFFIDSWRIVVDDTLYNMYFIYNMIVHP